MNNLELQLATPDDVLKLKNISRATFSTTFADINTKENMDKYLNESFSIEQLDTELRNQSSQFYFASLNNEVIGYMKLNTGKAQKENQNDNALEIERIYVLKDFHGHKVGQFLYNKAIELAKNLNVDYVWLGVWEKNARAIAFYTKNGFIKYSEHVFMLGDDKQTDNLMKLNLIS
ncbi:GNAT family N-acetyltransferase [Pedobacter aquatilis]|uniref:GNAT family N-acetyltransferase n=1 Tax=Pedobacter aquatilis TaxID=351343 RepID=UPI00292DFB25|nr:GNAT family N-acetyltransferase [Pedobacter aquatilis]